VPPAALVYDRPVGARKSLFLIPQGGGLERRLTDTPSADTLARFSSDGREIFFTSNLTGNWQIFEIPIEGGPARRVRTNSFTEWQVDPSPDGKSLAYLSNEGGPESLWILDLPSGRSRLLVRHGIHSVLGNPHWSPDGGRIVFSSNYFLGHHIYIVDVNTGRQTRLSGLLAGGCEPRFSPDGRRVVHVSRGHHLPRSWLVEHNLETGDERTLVDWPALNYDPVYSPDGTEIAFASNIAGEYHIYRYRLADGRSFRVTFGPGGARNPDYRPKGG
jgi:Tol biopolymer transport system component